MGVTVDTIGVDVVTNMGRLDREMIAVERRVDKSAKHIDGRFNHAFKFGGLLKGLTAVSGVRAASAGVQALERSLADPLATTASRTHDIADAAASSIPIFNEIYQIGRSISGIATGRLAKERQITQELAMQESRLKDMQRIGERRAQFNLDFADALAQSRIDAAGANTPSGIALKTDQALAELAKQVEKMRGDANLLLRGGPLKQRLREIDEFESNRRRAISREQKERLESLSTGPSFDTFNTVLGQFKSRVPGGSASKPPATEDTAKAQASALNKIDQNTSKMARTLERMVFA